jgi:Ribbon-helix-helix domain
MYNLPMKVRDKEKYAVYLDRENLNKLREYQERVGVPVSESIRRAIAAYVESLKKKV